MNKRIGRFLLSGLLVLSLGACKATLTEPAELFHFQPSDARLIESVGAALKSNRQLADFDILVQAREGVVELRGYVKTIHQSDLAGQIASRVNGVKTLQNDLIVRKYR